MVGSIQKWIIGLVVVSMMAGASIVFCVEYIREYRAVSQEAIERIQEARSECRYYWDSFRDALLTEENVAKAPRQADRIEELLRESEQLCIDAALELEAQRDE